MRYKLIDVTTNLSFLTRLALVGAFVTTFSGCDLYENVVDSLVKPTVRETSAHVLQLSGRKDPALSVEVNIEFQTTKRSCRRTVNWLEGAEANRRYTYNVPVQQTASEYEAKVPVDKLEPGHCEWFPFSINYTLRDKSGLPHRSPIPPTPLVWFSRDGADSLPPFEVECEKRPELRESGLSCRQPLGKYFLNTNTSSLSVNFRERAWFKTQNKTLGN